MQYLPIAKHFFQDERIPIGNHPGKLVRCIDGEINADRRAACTGTLDQAEKHKEVQEVLAEVRGDHQAEQTSIAPELRLEPRRRKTVKQSGV